MKSSATRNKSYNKKEAAKAESSEDEDSDSCSDNESSESVDNGRRRQRKIQQFSVLRSDSDGLRMKISAIRNKKEKPATNTSKNNNNHAEVGKREAAQKSNKSIKRKLSTASSSSCCCSESESSSVQTKEKLKKVRLKRKKNYTSSASDAKFAGLSTDSECGSGAAEKKDKELARIPAKPDGNLTSSTPKYGGENLPGSSISSSDTELPALVNAAIKCVESGSETENTPVSATQSVNQYTSTLLHDFMVKTQMLGGNCPDSEKSDVKTAPSGNVMGVPKSESGNAGDISDRTFKKEIQTKKKRGRPKKKTVLEAVATAVVNESGDSGITSTVQSSSSPSPNNPNIKKNKNIIQEAIQNGFLDQKDIHVPKINVASLEKQMYATERVLYPPRSKKKMAPKTNNRGKSSKDDVIDPLWRKIDVNTKFRRPSLTGYKSDGGNTVCSKILAAKSGYVSDYGSVGNRVLSGYKSDVSGKSRYSTRSCISRAKSCDFRCGSSSGRSRKMRRKRRMLEKPMKKFGNVNEQDILQLAGLSLGQSSEESSRESLSKPIISYGQSKKYGEINRFVRTGEYFGRNKKNMVSTALAEACQSVADNLNTRTNLFTNKLVCNATKYLEFSNELESLRSKIRSRRSSAVSRCSSLSMCSRYDVRKRRRRKFRIKSQSRSGFVDSKLNTEIEILISTFPSLCRINSDRTGYGKDKDRSDKDKGGLLGQKMLSKRNQKKRKLSESAEHHLAKKFPNDLCLLLKRRHKKTGNNCQDEHKLPLKKRHYLITPGERSDGRSAHHSMESRAKDVIELKTAGKHLANANAKLPPKAVTPKKRHLLESSNSPRPDESFMQSAKGNYSPLTTELKPSINLLENAGETGNTTRPSQKIEEKAKKKNRLEGVVSKIQSVGGHSSKETIRNSSDIPAPAYPPPGVFEPSVELEIQITLPKQALTIITKSEIDSPKNLLDPAELEKLLPEPKTERMVETLLNRTGGSLLLKRKRRKTFNRTGFPAMKKKKRKVISGVSTSASETDSKPIGPVPKFCKTPTVTATSSETVSCDRVPHIGETSTTFLQRTKQPRLSVVSLERLQEPNKKSETIEMIVKETTELGPGQVTNEIPKIGKRGRRSTLKQNISEVKPVEEAPVQKTVISTTSEKLCKSDVEMQTKIVGRKKASQASKGEFKANKEKIETKNEKEIKDKVESKGNKEKAIQKEKKENKPTKYTKGTPQHTSTSKATEKCDTTANTRSRNKTVNIPNTMNNLLPTTKILNVRLRRTKTYGGKVIESEMRRISQRSKSVTSSEIPTESATKTDKIKTNTTAEKTSRISSSLKMKSTKKESPSECSLLDDLEQEPLPLHEGPDSAQENSDSTSSGTKLKKITKLKKPYLPAGLLSDYYKCEKMRKPADKSDKPLLVVTNEQNTSKNILPPPPYCEKFFRKSNYDFLLPYDLWWAHTNSKLPARNTVPSWNYRKIRSNVYGDTRHNPSFEYQTCNCKPQTACGDDCLNRMVYTECSPSNCPCGDKCRNQKIQKHDIAPGTERFMTANKGWGVKANMSIRKGMYIMEYVGEVVTEKEFKERMATLYVNDTHHYCLHLDGGLVIDGHRMGSDGRFVNHSCSPNCEMQKWSVNGLFRMALFALRNIEPGEELTYDYNFSLFNPSEGQPCRCETPQCRGVIGGKSQRVKPLENKVVEPPPSNRHGRPRKRTAKKNSGRIQSKDVAIPQFQIPTDRERKIIKFKHCFLLRNLEKVRKIKMKSNIVPKVEESPTRPITPSSFAVQISALRNKRSIKTRGLTQAAHDPEVEKMAKMAVILRAICAELESIKDSTGKSQLSKLIPATKKKRASLEKPKPMGFATIQANIEKGYYKDAESFDADVNKVFDTATTFFEPNSEESLAIENLKNAYVLNKSKFYDQLAELVSEKSLKNFRSEQNEMKLQTPAVKVTEDIIRCICGLFKDEGLMIQCAKCLVWQHAECTKADIKAENYNCEKCDNRTVNYEIPLDEFTDDGFRYFLSLLRGDLQVRQGDTVYVLRDIPIKEENGKTIATKKHTYETIGTIDYSECDIFRVERLWKNDQGKRLIFGHHYLRPHETFHEPSRRFYANEVIRVPLYEVVPIELVIARCWVLDRSTFCKGRPVDCAAEQHVYICELRVDKSARFFSKAKQAYPTCTKNYAFKKFQEKLKIFKTYAPHDVDPNFLKSKKRKSDDVIVTPKKLLCPIIQLVPPPPKTLNEKRSRLEAVLVNLKLKKTSESRIAPVDLSYLLTGRGARQRRAITAVVPI